MEGDQSIKKDETLPPGFRFHPTDEELITFYLINKISDANFTGRTIGDVDLNKSEPWDLPAKAKMGEKEWYFFSLRDRKYPTGVRTNRATNTGYWKTTGKDREIFNSFTSELVGMKKTLVFYRGRAPRGEKSNWVMHEYRIHSKSSLRTTKGEWVVCRVFQKSAGMKKYPSNQSRGIAPYNLETGSEVHPTMMQPEHFQLMAGRNYMVGTDQLTEFNHVLRSGAMNINPQVQSQLNLGTGGCFTISAGLNLNLAGAVTATQPSVLRTMQPPMTALNHHMMADPAMMSNAGPVPHVTGFEGEISTAGISNNNRYMGMDQCVELDGYWPSYGLEN